MFHQLYEQDFGDLGHHYGQALSSDDKKWLSKVEGSVRRIEGRFQIDLPTRDGCEKLPNNKEQATKRLEGLKRRFQRDSEFKEKYKATLSEWARLGYIERVKDTSDCNGERVWYLPHHGVFHPKKKKKLRVVIDCSAKYKDISLNDLLIQGPDLLNPLAGILMRFRKGSVAIMGDIEAMFHQVQVLEKDRDLLRFLWWPDPDEEGPPEEYRLTVHLFGAASSPSCANFTLRRSFEESIDPLSDREIETLKRSFYMDDFLFASDSPSQALDVAQKAVKACADGGFKLSKFVSNNEALSKELRKEMDSAVSSKMNLNLEESHGERVLGIEWSITDDVFVFSSDLKERKATRRGILSTISSIYDPLGLISPILLPVKMILQECA
jgi:hypothetical protein